YFLRSGSSLTNKVSSGEYEVISTQTIDGTIWPKQSILRTFAVIGFKRELFSTYELTINSIDTNQKAAISAPPVPGLTTMLDYRGTEGGPLAYTSTKWLTENELKLRPEFVAKSRLKRGPEPGSERSVIWLILILPLFLLFLYR